MISSYYRIPAAKRIGKERKPMNKGWRHYFLGGLSLLLITFPSGCYSLPDHARSAPNPQALSYDEEQDGSAALSGDSAGHNNKDLTISSPKNDTFSAESAGSDAGRPEIADSPPVLPSDSAQSVNGEQDQKPEKISSISSAKKKPAANLNYDVNEPFNAGRPTLMGFKVHDKADDVLRRFGRPIDQFQMDDPEFPITVYEYPGFSIGFDPSKEIVFIEVNSDEVKPGLNGLRLGDGVGKALETLGKPDSKSDFVITFQSDDSTLKLDIDPASKTISSIKLF